MVGCSCDGFASLQLAFEYGEPTGFDIIMQCHTGDAFEDLMQMEWTDCKLRPDRSRRQTLREVCVYIVTNPLRQVSDEASGFLVVYIACMAESRGVPRRLGYRRTQSDWCLVGVRDRKDCNRYQSTVQQTRTIHPAIHPLPLLPATLPHNLEHLALRPCWKPD